MNHPMQQLMAGGVALTAVLFLQASFLSAEEPIFTDAVYESNLRKWQSLTEEQRQTVRERARTITPEEIKVLKEKADEFRKMPQEDQQRVRQNFQRFRDMPPPQKEKMRERFRRFEGMPQEQRQEFRRQVRERRLAPAVHPGESLPQGQTEQYRKRQEMRKAPIPQASREVPQGPGQGREHPLKQGSSELQKRQLRNPTTPQSQDTRRRSLERKNMQEKRRLQSDRGGQLRQTPGSSGTLRQGRSQMNSPAAQEFRRSERPRPVRRK